MPLNNQLMAYKKKKTRGKQSIPSVSQRLYLKLAFFLLVLPDATISLTTCMNKSEIIVLSVCLFLKATRVNDVSNRAHRSCRSRTVTAESPACFVASGSFVAGTALLLRLLVGMALLLPVLMGRGALDCSELCFFGVIPVLLLLLFAVVLLLGDMSPFTVQTKMHESGLVLSLCEVSV